MSYRWNILLLILFFLSNNALLAQTEEDKIKETILTFFDAMRKQDTAMFDPLLVPNATLQTSNKSKDEKLDIHSTPFSKFKQQIAGAKGKLLDEQITSWDIKVDGGLASVWVEYLFYLDGQFSHCGVDAFQMGKVGEDWKIMHLADTRTTQGCIENANNEIDAVMNAWHHAAAVADEDVFFGTMTDDGIYIGTDATEHWQRDSMAIWADKYFQKESAWAFTPTERNIFLDDNGHLAWFDELLDTWMGVCRGSGVMKKIEGNWKLSHYHLSIAVPNEVVQDYLGLINPKKE